MLKQRFAAGLLAAGALVAVSAGPALAYNATPETQNATVGQSVTINFGTYNPFTPGSRVTYGTKFNPNYPAGCVVPNGSNGGDCEMSTGGGLEPSASGVASVTFTPTKVGEYTFDVSGEYPETVTASATVIVTGATSGSGSSSTGSSSSSTGSSSSSLPKTGASINPAAVATLSGGLLLAGAGTFVFANRRRQTASK